MANSHVWVLVSHNMDDGQLDIEVCLTFETLLRKFDEYYDSDVEDGRRIEEYVREPEEHLLTYMADNTWEVYGMYADLYV